MLPLRFSAGVLFGLADNKRRRQEKDAEFQRMEYARMLQLDQRDWQAEQAQLQRDSHLANMKMQRGWNVSDAERNNQWSIDDREDRQQHAMDLAGLRNMRPQPQTNVNVNLPGQGQGVSRGVSTGDRGTSYGYLDDQRTVSGGRIDAAREGSSPSEVRDWMYRTNLGSTVPWEEVAQNVTDPEKLESLERDRANGLVLVHGPNGVESVPAEFKNDAAALMALNPGMQPSAVFEDMANIYSQDPGQYMDKVKEGQAHLRAQKEMSDMVGDGKLTREVVHQIRQLPNAPAMVEVFDDMIRMSSRDGEPLEKLIKRYGASENALRAFADDWKARAESLNPRVAEEFGQQLAEVLHASFGSFSTNEMFGKLEQLASAGAESAGGLMQDVWSELRQDEVIHGMFGELDAIPDFEDVEAGSNRIFQEVAAAAVDYNRKRKIAMGPQSRFARGVGFARGVETDDKGGVTITGLVPQRDENNRPWDPTGGWAPAFRNQVETSLVTNGFNYRLPPPEELTDEQLAQMWDRRLDTSSATLRKMPQAMIHWYDQLPGLMIERGLMEDGPIRNAMSAWSEKAGTLWELGVRALGSPLGTTRIQSDVQGEGTGVTIPAESWDELNWIQKILGGTGPGGAL